MKLKERRREEIRLYSYLQSDLLLFQERDHTCPTFFLRSGKRREERIIRIYTYIK
jgi:hypothetical protein